MADHYKPTPGDFEGFQLANRVNKTAGRPVVRWSTVYHMLIPWWDEYDQDEIDIESYNEYDVLEDDYSEESFP